MNGVFGIALQLGFILYVMFTFPEFGHSDDGYQAIYRHYAVVLTVLILLYAGEYYLIQGPKGLLNSNVLIVTSLIYWLLLDLIQSRYALDSVNAQSVKTAFVAISVFAITVQVSSNLSVRFPDLIERAARVGISPRFIFAVSVVCFAFAFYFYFRASYFDFNHMIRGLTRSRFASPWARGAQGGFDAIIEHFKYFGYILPSLTALLFMLNRSYDIRNYLSLLLTIFFSAFEFQGGGRRITGFLAGSMIMTVMIYKRDFLKIKHFIFVGAAGVALLVLLDMQLMFRNRGYEGMFEQYNLEQLDEVRVDDNFLRLTQVVEMIPRDYPHSGFQYLLWAFSRPIPRALWPGKPLGPGFDVAQMVGAKGVSLTSTIVGEAYASDGYFMVIVVGIIFGVLSGSLNRMAEQQIGVLGVALYSVGALALVGGVRSLPDLVVFSYAFLGMVVMYRFILEKRARLR